MFTLPDDRSASTFFRPYFSLFVDALEQAIRDCDAVHNLYTTHVLQEPVPFHANHRTPLIYTYANNRASQLFRGVEGVEVVPETNGTMELIFHNKVRLRFQKANDDLSFSTSGESYREKVFRNKSSLGIPLEYAAAFPVYAGYTLGSTGELKEVTLIHYDRNKPQWFVHIKAESGATDQGLPFNTNPIAPVPASGQDLVRPKQKPASN